MKKKKIYIIRGTTVIAFGVVEFEILPNCRTTIKK